MTQYDKTIKVNFLSVNRMKVEIGKSRERLSMLLPSFVWDKINTMGFSSTIGLPDTFAADDAGDLAILFADICEFDNVVSSCGERIVDILDDVFRGFDHLCKKYGIQKIEVDLVYETVGKTYMACGGLKFLEKELSARFNKNFTQRVVDLSVEMMKYVQGTTFTYGVKLNLKIGVHYGPCIYGVIGYHKPQFSLIGDTVNTTSRHCTTGENGTIVLSMAAKQKIDVSTVANSKTTFVEMKGKGMVEVLMIMPPKKNIISLDHIRDVSGSMLDAHTHSNRLNFQSSAKRRATLNYPKIQELILPRSSAMGLIEPFSERIQAQVSRSNSE